eukprot:3834276-Amphidinium_carterae.1
MVGSKSPDLKDINNVVRRVHRRGKLFLAPAMDPHDAWWKQTLIPLKWGPGSWEDEHRIVREGGWL